MDGLSKLVAAGATGSEAVTPPCAICSRRTGRPREPLHLTHGVVVWLCATHGAETFLRRGEGRDFVDRLAAAWVAAGAMGARRARALNAHLSQQRRTPPRRVQPGSYAWPRLRSEAERRFAAGESPRRVIAELRRRHARDTAQAPSERTMRRWFCEARWRTTSVPFAGARRDPSAPYPPPARKLPPLPPGFVARPFAPFDEWWQRWRTRR